MAGEARALLALLLLTAASERGDGDDEHLGLPGRVGRLAGSISNAVLEGLEPDLIVDRIDVDHLVARIDPDDIVARTDVDALLDRVDVNQLLDRVDVDRLLDHVDVDRLLDRVDVDRLLERADIEGLVRRAGIPEIVAESTGHVAGSALDVLRQQVVALDVVVMRTLVRLVGRDPDTAPAGPRALVGDAVGDAPSASPQTPRGKAQLEVTGHYAGLLSRVAAHAADVAAATAGYTAVTAGLSYVLVSVFGLDLGSQLRTGPAWVGGLAVWMLLYWWASIGIAGRTPAMLIAGLRVVTRDGEALRPRAALLRTLVLPVSSLPFGAGFLGIVLDREHRALHDLVAGTTVVYDWGARSAQMPSPLGRWLTRTERSDDGTGQAGE